MSYRDLETRPATAGSDPLDGVAESWLLGPFGRMWLGGMGDAKDLIAGWAKEAVKARFASVAPAAALAAIGEERGMPRGAVEPEDVYRARLKDAWELWQFAGTAYGLLVILYAAGYPSVVIQTQLGQQLTLSPSYDPANRNPAADLQIFQLTGPVHLGGSPELWSQFAVLITQPWPAWWGGSAPGFGSADEIAFVALLKQWKAAHSQFVKVEVVTGPTWGFAGVNWGGFTWGGGTTVVWLPQPGTLWGGFSWGAGNYVPLFGT